MPSTPGFDRVEQKHVKMMNDVIQTIRNDVKGARQRATTMEDFLKRIAIYTNINPLNTRKYQEPLSKLVTSIENTMGLPIGGHREVFKETAYNETMGLVTNVGEDMRTQLKTIVANGLKEGKSSLEIAKDIDEQIEGINAKRAKVIARTETHRAKNLGNWYINNEKGYKYFTVRFAKDACEKCKKAFRGIVFTMDQLWMLPPFHPNCRCAAMFWKRIPKGFKLFKGKKPDDIEDINSRIVEQAMNTPSANETPEPTLNPAANSQHDGNLLYRFAKKAKAALFANNTELTSLWFNEAEKQKAYDLAELAGTDVLTKRQGKSLFYIVEVPLKDVESLMAQI